MVSEPSTNSKQREGRARSIFALLGRLALHYYRPDFTEGQSKLVIEDMIGDLIEYDPRDVAEACTAWRRKPEASYFPKSGQLIGCIRERHEASIANARANKPAFRAIQYETSALAAPLKPYRQILAEKNLALPVPDGERPSPPAQQEELNEAGELSPERRSELRELRMRVVRDGKPA